MMAIQSRDGRLFWESAHPVTPKPDEVLVHVRAAGVNRADLLQASGAYPPPHGASDILGLEIAGVVDRTGERVCALVPGGGYASMAAVDRRVLIPLPGSWTFEQGASLPEAWLTAFVNLFLEGGLQGQESVLIHAGASGVGTAAIQLARDAGATVFVTVGSEEKADLCRSLGAERAINYRTSNFGDELGAERVDVVIDCVGASYLAQNISVLKRFGRLVSIGLLGGAKAELNLAAVLRKRLRLVGSTLRSRSRTEHAAITREFCERYLHKLASGELRLIIDRVFPIEEAQAAHDYVAANRNAGKVVLRLP